ncbi:microsomal epoxide hydrolase [Xylariaceae sp. FL1019]|nr:microsomal epoxide hydrolase [Xylariaceae sp. FL1019]
MADGIRPYTISIPDSDLEDLRERLRRTRFPSELSDVGTTMGSPLEAVKRIATYWAEKYDWRAAEASLNALPQFKTSIQVTGFEALDIHFLHVRSKREDAVPLIFVHGWPGSFLEGTKILKPLTEPEDASQPAFHVVVPSLPGYGFSQASSKAGFSIDQHAETMHLLMLKLGYREYATQGGDWGYGITRAMGRRYAPEFVKAQHLNMSAFPTPSLLRNPIIALKTMFQAFVTGVPEKDKKGFERSMEFQKTGNGYFKIQSTRPQTLGYALSDSPTGLLAWIYEKLVEWTDQYPWTEDEVCTWISIYWFSTATPRAAHQLYYETEMNQDAVRCKKREQEGIPASTWDQLLEYQNVKIGLSKFPRDIIVLPTFWSPAMGNVVFSNEHEGGGHFAAWERPDDLIKDLRTMFGPNGGANGAVKTAAKL